MPEFVVIGAGIVGCAVAWGLARSGAEVTLLEKQQVASGASGGPGCRGVRANGRDARELPLAQRAYDLWPRLADNLGNPTGYRRIGGLHLLDKVSGAENGKADLETRRMTQAAAGIPTDLIDRDRIRDMEPEVGPGASWALSCPLDGIADHTATTRAFAAAATQQGADIREQQSVQRIRTATNKQTIVETTGEQIVATRAVLVLANSYTPMILERSFGIRLPVWRFVPQMHFIHPSPGFTINHLLGHDSRKLAVKQLGPAEVMVSGGQAGRWNEATDRGESCDEARELNLADAVAVLPGLKDAEFSSLDASRPESCSFDHIPIIDVVPKVRTVLFATGWSGHGFAIAPAVAEYLVNWALTRQRPKIFRPFCLSRFPGWQRI